MSLVLTLGEVIDRLPGWQDASWTELDGGLTNRTWLLEKEGVKTVLKIDPAARSAPYSDRRGEALVQTAAAEAGLANRVLYADDRVLLSEYAEGEVWTPRSFADADNLARLADALHKLHALAPTERSFDAAGAADVYVQSIERDPDIVAICRDIIAAVRTPQRVCLCHNDLVAENIVATPDIRFLDWEYACDNDPLFDLATIVEHHELSEGQAQHLLEYYSGSGTSSQQRLNEQRQLYRALLWLWLASRPGSAEAELDEVAGRLLTSCS